MHSSVHSRYEDELKRKEKHVLIGDGFQVEWGLRAKVGNYFEGGCSGYWHRQVTKDSGKNASDVKQRVQGSGPEDSFSIPQWRLNGSIRSIWEFKNRNANQGNMTVFTLTKAF